MYNFNHSTFSKNIYIQYLYTYIIIYTYVVIISIVYSSGTMNMKIV